MYAYSADFLISLFLTPRFGVLLHDATSFTVPHELKGLRRCRHAIVHKSRTSSSQKFLFPGQSPRDRGSGFRLAL